MTFCMNWCVLDQLEKRMTVCVTLESTTITPPSAIVISAQHLLLLHPTSLPSSVLPLSSVCRRRSLTALSIRWSPSRGRACPTLGADLSRLCSVQQSWSIQTCQRPSDCGPGESRHKYTQAHTLRHTEIQTNCSRGSDIHPHHDRPHPSRRMLTETNHTLWAWLMCG